MVSKLSECPINNKSKFEQLESYTPYEFAVQEVLGGEKLEDTMRGTVFSASPFK